ncbi:MAG: iron-containing alcohol dehydrogenase [Anaerolineae bacterium]|nr:iron-containing alcohol dehydrogenase [Anaerolineae bacterium]
MNRTIKLCVLGGSALATPMLFESMGRQNARGSYQVCLHGRDSQRLAMVKKISEKITCQFPDLDLSITATLDMREAIEGAAFILNQIRVGGLKARLFDETFPRKYGIPGEETVGPGGFSNALRGIPVVLDHCKTIEKYAPQAVMLNLMNPSSLIQYAVTRYTSVNVVGTCDTPVSTCRMVSNALGLPKDKSRVSWFGMHHFGWLFDLAVDGQSRLDAVFGQLERMANLGVDPEIVTALRAIPAPYLKYYFHPDRMLAMTEGRKPRAEQLIEVFAQLENAMDHWSEGQPLDFMQQRGAGWYDKIVVPTLLALAEKRESDLILSVGNEDSVAWLPKSAVIEAPVAISEGKIGRPRIPASIPEDIQGMIMRNCAYEMLAVEAIVEHDRSKALRALQSNLLVKDFNQVRGIMGEIWPEEARPAFKLIAAEKPAAEASSGAGKPGFAVPTLHYGEKAIERMPLREKKYAVITMEIPWVNIRQRFPRDPEVVVYVDELDWYALEAIERSLPEIDLVVGVGGGMATDGAKFVGWKRRIPVDVVPTITSVDASVTKSIAARSGGHVTYIGYVVPRDVYVDYPVIRGAPKRLNRSGVGDILCSHVALFDWKLSHDHTGEEYDPSAVDQMKTWLEKIETQAADIEAMNDNGIRLIMNAFEDISIICRKFGSSRPQEASDHTFAYNAEFQTGKKFLHGELVALGAYVLATLQNNDPEYLRDIYSRTGILWQPRDIGLTRAEFANVLGTLNWYQKNFGRRYSILDEVHIDSAFIEMVQAKLDF